MRRAGRRKQTARSRASTPGGAVNRSVRGLVLVAAVGLGLSGATIIGGVRSAEAPELPPPSERAHRAFGSVSWWNTPLGAETPLHPDGEKILRYIRTAPQSGDGCLTLAGAGDSQWGHPIYWSKPSDPTYSVTGVVQERPPELAELRIPAGAQPAANNDRSMTIYDLDAGYVVALSGAEYDEEADRWTATGATVTYLSSNGLHVDTGRSDDPRNAGTHRGNNGATMAVSWDMVQAGAVRQVLKVALGPEVANRYVFPMVGSDGDYEGGRDGVPAQGLRLRIKASVDLDELNLHPEALVIAEALQRYGFYIGDSGGSTALKLENTRAEGRGQLWTVPPDALCAVPFTSDYWEVVAEDYDPS